MTHASLFSGIGGFDLAAQWMGWSNAFHCEWNPFCQTVLKYYWPNATTYTDITTTDFTLWRGRIDILTGGFPCQPFSTAGQRKGTSDDRYLWPQMLRAIREIAPRWVVGENVDGIFTWNNGLVFETVCAELENEGYEVQALRIPACATGAPHRRDRWWFVANSKSTRMHGIKGNICKENGRQVNELLSKSVQSDFRIDTNPTSLIIGRQGRSKEGDNRKWEDNKPVKKRNQIRATINASVEFSTHTSHTGPQRDELRRTLGQRTGPSRPIAERFENEHWLEAATRLCVLDDGLSGRLDAAALSTKPQHAAGKWRKESLKAAGNAIVPQVAYQIYQAIAHADQS